MKGKKKKKKRKNERQNAHSSIFLLHGIHARLVCIYITRTYIRAHVKIKVNLEKSYEKLEVKIDNMHLHFIHAFEKKEKKYI